MALSQSLSSPSLQISASFGPQSNSHEHLSSLASHEPSPHTGGGPQSISQLYPDSIPSQVLSPQHEFPFKTEVHWNPSFVHLSSLQGIGF